MKKMVITALLPLLSVLILPGCDKGEQQVVTAPPQGENGVTTTRDATPGQDTQFEIENTRYLFDVTDHSVEELAALLQRAEEITETHPVGYEDLEIVLILHGPDINLFTTQNYQKNRRLVDLAAKLDAFEIIDMKVCEKSMSGMGVSRSDVPAFIESVPFAPAEIKRLEDEGYINL